MIKTFKLELKDMTDTGTFTGWASVYGNRDLGGDIVEPGAFTKTIATKNGEVPILWQHDAREPIGLGKLSDSSEGLQIAGELVLESPIAQKAYALLKKGVLKGLSIGYDTVRDEIKNSARHLKELKLYEVSIVTFPMNELATVQGVKDMSREEIDFRIEEMLKSMTSETKKFQALADRYAALKAPISPPEAKQDNDAPEFLHPSLDRISQLLRGEL